MQNGSVRDSRSSPPTYPDNHKLLVMAHLRDVSFMGPAQGALGKRKAAAASLDAERSAKRRTVDWSVAEVQDWAGRAVALAGHDDPRGRVAAAVGPSSAHATP